MVMTVFVFKFLEPRINKAAVDKKEAGHCLNFYRRLSVNPCWNFTTLLAAKMR